ncbi:MAG: carbohydrate kinase, partial [Bacteroidales bacterium]|nr:carbohydrate kinase [Bacteroidales bacterium]
MAASGLDTSLIDAIPELPTSKVVVHLEENNNARYEICAPVAWDNLRLSPALVKAAAAEGIIIFGTLASRNSVSHDTLLKLLKGDALRVID